MGRAIQSRSVSLDGVEEQDDVRAVLVGMRDHGNRIAGLVGLECPSHAGIRPIAEASTTHVPTVDGSAAPDGTATTIWLCGFCHRYSRTTPRYVTFWLTSNIAREWWASAGPGVRVASAATASATSRIIAFIGRLSQT